MSKARPMKAFFEDGASANAPAAPRVRQGVALPRNTTFGLREKAWRTIRHLRQFTLNELLEINATGAEKRAPCNLSAYLIQLEAHGVLLRLNRRAPGTTQARPGHVIWWLANDLGWEAPVWRRTKKVLWNPNTKTIIPMPSEPGASS